MSNNLLKGIIALLVCIFGSYVIKFPPTTDQSKEKENISNTETKPAEQTQPKLAATMSRQLVTNLIDNYKNNQLASIESAQKNAVPNDAKSIWFDLKVLKSYIESIESTAPKDNKGLGIRFYYAAYPDFSEFGKPGFEELSDLTDKYSRKHTLILIPTTNVNGDNTDFNSGGETKRSGSDISALNHGDIKPPKGI